VLVIADYYLPGFRAGGPIRAMANTIEQLAGEVSFFVVTRGHDTDSVPYPGVRQNGWNPISHALVYYGRFSLRLIEQRMRDSRADVIWLNSFFSRASMRVLLLRRIGRMAQPILLGPRGEFSAGALALKPWRKSLAIRCLTRMGFLDGIHWIASSHLEADEIRATVGTSSITLTPESVRLSAAAGAGPNKLPGHVHLVCASRITPKKNLHFLLDVLARCSGAITLDVIGPIDDAAYWAKCRQLIARLPASITVKYLGEFAHAELMRRLPAYDVLVLPSRGENFGHIVVEAWAAGCPVLVSDLTPWRNLAEDGVGWDLPLVCERWVEALQRCAAMTNADRLMIRTRAIERAWRVWREGRGGDETLKQLIVRLARGVEPLDRSGTSVARDAIAADMNPCA
jgi:glycosyltransferase involved in cell wall biosynthesis